MAALDAAPLAAAEHGVAGHFFAGVLDRHRVGADDYAHRLTDQPPRHAVGAGVELDAALRIDPADELTYLHEGHDSLDRAQVDPLQREALPRGTPVVP